MGDLRPGSLLCSVSETGVSKGVRLSILFKTNDNDRVFGLISKAQSSVEGGRIVSSDGRTLGRIVSVGSQLQNSKELDQFFYAVDFDQDLIKGIASELKPVAFSKNLSENLVSAYPMKVRALKVEHKMRIYGKRKSNRPHCNRRGFLVGEIAEPVVFENGAAKATLARGALVVGKGHKSFAEKGDSGTPVLSSSRALMGFVMAKSAEYSLIMPAEDIIDKYHIKMFSYSAAYDRHNIRPETTQVAAE